MRRKCYRVGRSTAGLGLFATAPIAKGDFIVEYSGRRIPTREALAREAKTGCRYMFAINSRWTVDGSSRRNMGRYANHSCRPNAESTITKGKVMLRAIEAIEPGEEITYDYGRDYFELFIKPKGCKCVKCLARARKAPARKRRDGAD
jgi:SET domain-containing protein